MTPRGMSSSIDWFVPVLTLYREGRNQEEFALRAIAHVIINRAKDTRWPNSVSKVCLNTIKHVKQGLLGSLTAKVVWEFSSYMPSDPNSQVWPKGDNDSDWVKCAEAWYVANNEADFTNGANFYHSFVNPGQYPSWATEASFVMSAGAFKLHKR